MPCGRWDHYPYQCNKILASGMFRNGDGGCNYYGRRTFKCGIPMYDLLQETSLLDVLEEISWENIPLQPNAQHEQFGQEYMANILFDFRLRLDNREDLWTDATLNPKLHCPHGKIVYELMRSGAIVCTWRYGRNCPGRSHNGVKYPIRVIVAYKGRYHALERYDPSNPTTENGCTTLLTSWIERWPTARGPHLPWEKDAIAKFALQN